MWKRRVIISNTVPSFLEEGGCLEYRPVQAQRGWNWQLWAVYPDGMTQPVISSKTGEPRVFKSADALLAYHIRLYDDETGLHISTVETTRTKRLIDKL